jgi:hypothetical protein
MFEVVNAPRSCRPFVIAIFEPLTYLPAFNTSYRTSNTCAQNNQAHCGLSSPRKESFSHFRHRHCVSATTRQSPTNLLPHPHLRLNSIMGSSPTDTTKNGDSKSPVQANASPPTVTGMLLLCTCICALPPPFQLSRDASTRSGS